MVLANAAISYADCPESPVKYSPVSLAPNHVLSWEHHYEFRSGKWSRTDYNFETPSTNLLTTTSTVIDLPDAPKYEIFDYPGEYVVKGNGDPVTKVRMEEEEAGYSTVNAASQCCTFTPCGKFTLQGHDVDAENGDYMITSIRHAATEASYGSTGDGTTYNLGRRLVSLRKLAIAVGMIFLVAMVVSVALRFWQPLVGLLSVVPLCGVFWCRDTTRVGRWQELILGLWSEELAGPRCPARHPLIDPWPPSPSPAQHARRPAHSARGLPCGSRSAQGNGLDHADSQPLPVGQDGAGDPGVLDCPGIPCLGRPHLVLPADGGTPAGPRPARTLSRLDPPPPARLVSAARPTPPAGARAE
jgi:Phage tail baseplate hub (GPD)